jgi:hypothetical protein
METVRVDSFALGGKTYPRRKLQGTRVSDGALLGQPA